MVIKAVPPTTAPITLPAPPISAAKITSTLRGGNKAGISVGEVNGGKGSGKGCYGSGDYESYVFVNVGVIAEKLDPELVLFDGLQKVSVRRSHQAQDQIDYQQERTQAEVETKGALLKVDETVFLEKKG